MKTGPKPKQFAGQPHTFMCKHRHSGVLPERGVTTDFAKWRPSKQRWECAKCYAALSKRWREGKSATGMRGLASNKLSVLRSLCRRKGWAVPKIDADILTIRLETHSRCCDACGKSMDFGGKDMCLDHDHKTGEVRGLICRRCNMVEGVLATMTSEELSGLLEYLGVEK